MFLENMTMDSQQILFHQKPLCESIKIRWKKNKVSPCPIALLPAISKILEGFVCRQLLSHCLNNIIPDEQFGFLPKRYVVWQLLAVVEEWEKAFDEGR